MNDDVDTIGMPDRMNNGVPVRLGEMRFQDGLGKGPAPLLHHQRKDVAHNEMKVSDVKACQLPARVQAQTRCMCTF